MNQLTYSDNCEPRALSKGTAVIVLIGPSCYVTAQNDFECDCAAVAGMETRTYNIKGTSACVYWEGEWRGDGRLALWGSLARAHGGLHSCSGNHIDQAQMADKRLAGALCVCVTWGAGLGCGRHQSKGPSPFRDPPRRRRTSFSGNAAAAPSPRTLPCPPQGPSAGARPQAVRL